MKHARGLERKVPVAGDDDVIQQADVEQGGGSDHLIGQRLVLRTGFGGSRRMVVDQDKACGQQLQCPFDDQPMVDNRGGDATLTHPLPFDNAVRRSEVDHPALLVRKPLQLRPEHPHDIVARGDKIRRGTLGDDPPPPFGSSQQHPRTTQPQPADHPQAGLRFSSQPRQRTPTSLQQRRGKRFFPEQQGQQLGIAQRPGTPRSHLIGNRAHGRISLSILSSNDAHCSSVISCDTEKAACCSASFFESPEPCPTSMPSISTLQ